MASPRAEVAAKCETMMPANEASPTSPPKQAVTAADERLAETGGVDGHDYDGRRLPRNAAASYRAAAAASLSAEECPPFALIGPRLRDEPPRFVLGVLLA